MEKGTDRVCGAKAAESTFPPARVDERQSPPRASQTERLVPFMFAWSRM